MKKGQKKGQKFVILYFEVVNFCGRFACKRSTRSRSRNISPRILIVQTLPTSRPLDVLFRFWVFRQFRGLALIRPCCSEQAKSTKKLVCFFTFSVCLRTWSPFRRLEIVSREIKIDVNTWSYVKRQTAKMKLLPSVFNSRVNIFVFVAISRRHFCIFM